MTRKDYIAISRAISIALDQCQSLPEQGSTHAAAAVHGAQLVMNRIASVLAAENPRFDRAKFLAACGVVS